MPRETLTGGSVLRRDACTSCLFLSLRYIRNRSRLHRRDLREFWCEAIFSEVRAATLWILYTIQDNSKRTADRNRRNRDDC